MSLKDLTKHIDDQEKAISELRPESISQTARSTYWSDFRDSLWGEGLESFQEEENVKRGIDPVEDIALPERHIVATLPVAPLPPWNMLIRHADTDADTRKFLVRSEYDEAEREAVSSSKAHAMFVVSGQPGIGKSIFLVWLLMRRLALRLPTVLQIYSSCAILFHEDGVLELTDPEDPASYWGLGYDLDRWDQRDRRIWALVDLGSRLQEPTGIFKSGSPFFVVNAMSPHFRQEWYQKINCRRFFMNPWSISEVLQARPFFYKSPTERQLQYLYDEFGASPGTLDMFADRPGDYVEKVREGIDKILPGKLRQVFHDPGSYDFSHYVVTIRPSPTNRHMFVSDPASLRVLKMLCDKYTEPPR